MSDSKETHEITEESKEFSESATQNRIELAWKLILEQYLEHSKKVAHEEGPGVSVFHLLRQPQKVAFNCEYFYAEKDGTMWKMLMNTSSDGKRISEKYEPNSTIIICVQVPIGLSGNDTVGNMKLISIETGREVLLDEDLESDLKATSKISSSRTLYKRNVKGPATDEN